MVDRVSVKSGTCEHTETLLLPGPSSTVGSFLLFHPLRGIFLCEVCGRKLRWFPHEWIWEAAGQSSRSKVNKQPQSEDEGPYEHLLCEYFFGKIKPKKNHANSTNSDLLKKYIYLITCLRYPRTRMTRRLVCLSVQPALSKCEATLKNWRELLQRAHDSVPAEVFFNLAVALGLIWHGLVVLGLVYSTGQRLLLSTISFIAGPSWSTPTQKDCKSLLANCWGPPKKCLASMGCVLGRRGVSGGGGRKWKKKKLGHGKLDVTKND